VREALRYSRLVLGKIALVSACAPGTKKQPLQNDRTAPRKAIPTRARSTPFQLVVKSKTKFPIFMQPLKCLQRKYNTLNAALQGEKRFSSFFCFLPKNWDYLCTFYTNSKIYLLYSYILPEIIGFPTLFQRFLFVEGAHNEHVRLPAFHLIR
jgi:hypothetical protein